MKDETFAFISDVKDKKITARSARHTRTHCGKGGRVRFPSDNLSKKELQKMNGECKSYRLNDPMAWKEFKAMPDDIKITYVKLLRKKFNVPGKNIAEMLGICAETFSKEINRLGISEGKNCRGRCTPWDREGFYAWWHGVDKLPTPVPEEIPVIEEVVNEELEAFVEDDLPFDVVPIEEPKLPELHIALCAEIDGLKKRVDELLKCNEELMAAHEKDKAHIAWLEVRVDELGQERLMLEKQMDVVRLIFGGGNHG